MGMEAVVIMPEPGEEAEWFAKHLRRKVHINLDFAKQDNSIEENILNKAAVINSEAISANPIAESISLQRGAPIKNRLLKSAMSEALGTTDNRVTKSYPVLYRAWANGGIGLLITGNVMIDRRALGEPNNVAIEDDRDMPLLKEWASSSTENGTQCWVQLNHPGKQSPKGLNEENLSPSAIPFRADMQSW